jgi:hypothetical protein
LAEDCLAEDDLVADGGELVDEVAEEVLLGKGVDVGFAEGFAEAAACACASCCCRFRALVKHK